jgi:helix-turn-helix protein
VKRLADQTLYEILEVREDAAAAEIQAACERARDIYGPGSLATYTLMTPDEADMLAKRIDEARATLLDPEARARYDDALRRSGEAVAAAGGANGAGAPFGSLPPVIPAAQPPPAAPPQAGEPAEARPAILLAAALEVPEDEEPPEAGEEPPAARPIQLEREVAAPPQAQPAPPPAAAVPPPLPAPMPLVPDGAWTGDALRQAREARGLTVQQIAERTKVTRHHIENIEGERFGALPAPVYLRGILLSLARELRLDGQKVARAYLERASAALSGRPK